MENSIVTMNTTSPSAQPHGYKYPAPSSRSVSSVTGDSKPIKVRIKVKASGHVRSKGSK
jgi:hypothetical protein